MKGTGNSMTREQKILKLARKITDRVKVTFHVEPLTTKDPDYYGIDAALQIVRNKYGQSVEEDVLDLALTFDRRKPVTYEVIKGRVITYKRPLRLTILQSGVRFFNDALTFISYFFFTCI